MDQTLGVVVLLTLLVIIVAVAAPAATRTVGVVARYDGEPYRVAAGYSNASEAADLIARLNADVIALLGHVKAKYLGRDKRGTAAGAAHPARAAAVARALRRYDPESLFENPPSGGGTSYTVNKGESLALCLRERDASLEDTETMRFVVFHELAHLCTPVADGHRELFWRTFKFLLLEAQEAGLIRPVDYAARPESYCGMEINYNPLFDANLEPL